jgi:hypothetical protein
MIEMDGCLFARIERLEAALRFYATAQVVAIKKAAFDDGMGDCSPEWVEDHGDIARQALNMIPAPQPPRESCGNQIDLEDVIPEE